MTYHHDWNATRNTLVAASIPAFKDFFATHPLETVRAIGYTWEWGQPTAAFYCVAQTQKGMETALLGVNRYRTELLGADEALETIRWDAGYFAYPGGLIGPNDELGAAWEMQAVALHAMTEKMMAVDTNDPVQYENYTRQYEAFLAELVTMCCEALAEIARDGHLDDYSKLDLWVGSTDENGHIVKARDARIRDMIRQKNP